MKKQLYLAIVDRLKDIPGPDGESLFKHFDLWNQQVEFIEQETPFQCPAVFVEFLPLQWQTMGNRVQSADLTTRLHIVTEWHALNPTPFSTFLFVCGRPGTQARGVNPQ